MKLIKIVQIATLFAGTAFITACAPMISGVMNAGVDENSVIEKTAKYFGVARDAITVTSIDKGALSTSYQARNAGKLYNCTIYYGDVNCTEPGSAAAGSRVSGPVVSSESKSTSNDLVMSPAQAQTRLNQLGFTVGVPDGVFGKKSVDQLKLFQKSRGLMVTGKLDTPSIQALR